MPTNSTHIALICAVVVLCFALYEHYSIVEAGGLASVFLGYAGVREQQRIKMTSKIDEARINSVRKQ